MTWLAWTKLDNKIRNCFSFYNSVFWGADRERWIRHQIKLGCPEAPNWPWQVCGEGVQKKKKEEGKKSYSNHSLFFYKLYKSVKMASRFTRLATSVPKVIYLLPFFNDTKTTYLWVQLPCARFFLLLFLDMDKKKNQKKKLITYLFIVCSWLRCCPRCYQGNFIFLKQIRLNEVLEKRKEKKTNMKEIIGSRYPFRSWWSLCHSSLHCCCSSKHPWSRWEGS